MTLSSVIVAVNAPLTYTGSMSSTIARSTAVTHLTPDEAIGMTVNQQLFARGLSAAQFAPIIGVSKSSVSRKLRGTVGWSVTELLVTAAFFGLQVQDLMPSWQPGDGEGAGTWVPAPFVPGRAASENRTPDLFITSESLCRLS